MRRQSKRKAKANLQAALDEIDNFDQPHYGTKEFGEWMRDTETAIRYTFDSKAYISRFLRIASELSTSYRSEKRSDAVAKTQQFLKSLLDEIERFWEDDIIEQPVMPAKMPIGPDDKDVFVIHGKNQEVLESVKLFLKELGLNPIILSDQPGRGRTIIRKFEDHAQVKYAVALLTPDDKALLNESNGKKEELRARQNVIFEKGFFIGSLGRDRVTALLLGETQIPSDYSGVEYIKLDQPTWKNKLYKELYAAGFSIEVEQSVLDSCEGFAVDKVEQDNDIIYEISSDYNSDESITNWSDILHLVSEAYYMPAGEEQFATTSVLDPISPAISCIKLLKQEGNPKDSYGNEFPGVQYYLVILDDIKPELGKDLLMRYNNADLIRWRLVVENKEVWETRAAVLSKTERRHGGRSRVTFRIPEMEILRSDSTGNYIQ